MNLLHRLLFWLTHDVICSWCQATKRRAWLRRRKQPATHGICRPCLIRMVHSQNHQCFNTPRHQKTFAAKSDFQNHGSD